jgi:SAM-dependent methyltransferase
MADPIFEERRLAEIYDPLDPDRVDLEAYLAIVDELGAGSILDVGCGTGTFACLLAQRGLEVVAVDPARASLEVALRKPGADRVRWLHSDATGLPPMQLDVATMTGNVAQVFLSDEDLRAALHGIRAAIRPGSHLVFETRDPARKGWLEWNREGSERVREIPDVGAVRSWVETLAVGADLVTFRWTFVFESDGGTTITSDSTLRFRSRDQITYALDEAGFAVEEVRDAPDRPGREHVFIARRIN